MAGQGRPKGRLLRLLSANSNDKYVLGALPTWRERRLQTHGSSLRATQEVEQSLEVQRLKSDS